MSPHVSLGKKSVMIYLPTELVDESRRYGLNISRISQNALKDTISKLDGTTKPAIESDGDRVVRPPGFSIRKTKSPTTSALLLQNDKVMVARNTYGLSKQHLVTQDKNENHGSNSDARTKRPTHTNQPQPTDDGSSYGAHMIKLSSVH